MHPNRSGEARAARHYIAQVGELSVLNSWIGRNSQVAQEPDKVGLGTTRRPVIGLALGGGAARGLSHIGILRTLIAHGIVPNIVVGTSIGAVVRSEEHTSELQSQFHLVCRLLLEKKNNISKVQ